jgi:hypothetical protein
VRRHPVSTPIERETITRPFFPAAASSQPNTQARRREEVCDEQRVTRLFEITAEIKVRFSTFRD